MRTKPRLTRPCWVRAAVLSLLILTGVAWLMAIDGHPVDRAVLAGMSDPACAAVHEVRAGSLLMAQQPDSEVCRSYFIYRSGAVDAADDPYAYRLDVMHQRVEAFWQIFAFVLVLWGATIGVAAGGLLAIRYWTGRARRRRGTAGPQAASAGWNASRHGAPLNRP